MTPSCNPTKETDKRDETKFGSIASSVLVNKEYVLLKTAIIWFGLDLHGFKHADESDMVQS